MAGVARSVILALRFVQSSLGFSGQTTDESDA